MGKKAVIAVGGNSLILDSGRKTVEDQLEAIREIVEQIVEFISAGWEVVVTHGNGPQVGFILRRSEIAFEARELHFVPLKNCVADTQGAIGFQFQESFANAFKRRNIDKTAVTLVTQVVVDPSDSSFCHPSKPIGEYYSEAKATRLANKFPQWHFTIDSKRRYRRVVPSPKPVRIVEMDAIRTLVAAGYCVIAAGGGGIPTLEDANGGLSAVDAVVDKDYTSGILAKELEADLLIISTGVEQVYLNFGKPDQTGIDRLTTADARKYIREGRFAEGSMLPKIEAAVDFVESRRGTAIITNRQNLERAIAGQAGTRIVR